jgi:hypothetical protein
MGSHIRVLAFVAVLALAAAACGGDDDSAGVVSVDDVSTAAEDDRVATQGGETGSDADPADDADGVVDTEAALLEFAQCLRDQGLDAADPQMDADGNVNLGGVLQSAGLERGQIQEVLDACGEFLEGLQQRFGDVDQTERQDSLLAFAQCMRDNGIDMPDPDFSGGGGPGPGGGPFGELDRGDPDFQAGLEACQDTLPGIGGRLAGGSGGGGAGG